MINEKIGTTAGNKPSTVIQGAKFENVIDHNNNMIAEIQNRICQGNGIHSRNQNSSQAYHNRCKTETRQSTSDSWTNTWE